MRDPTENILSLYIKDIQQIPTLSAKEEKKLIARVKKGNREAFERIILSNLKFVVKVASLYKGRGLPLTDIISEGNIGLMEALWNFKPDREVRFLTYAIFRIKQKIQKALFEQVRVVRFPICKITDSSKIRKVKMQLSKDKGYEPSIKELADILGMNVKRVKVALESVEREYSLDAEIIGLEHITLGDAIASENGTTFSLEVKDSLRFLSEKEREIVNFYFGLKDGRPHTLEETGKEFNLSRERVRQIKDNAIRTLRKSWRE